MIGVGVVPSSGTLTLQTATIASTDGTARSFSNTLALGGTTAFGQTSGGTGDLTFSGNGTLGGGMTLNVYSKTTFSGTITGATFGITKNGTGTLILAGNNAFTGATLINANSGILQIGNGGTTGSLANTSTITDNATLVFNRSDLITQGTYFNSVIGGSGQVIQAGSGTLVLNGVNTYTGITTINSGILSVGALTVGAAGNIGSTSGAAGNLVLNGGVLQYTGSTATYLRSFTLGAGGGTLDGSGSGTLTLGNSGSAVALTGAGASRTLTLTGAQTGNNTLQLTITDSGASITSVTKAGGGTWVLTGNNTYTGATTINAGLLTLSSSGSIGNSATINVGGTGQLNVSAISNYTLNNGQTLKGTGTVVGGVSVGGGAHFAPGNSVGTENVGSLTLTSGSILDFEFGSITGNDQIIASGTLTLNGSSLSKTSFNIYDEGTTTLFSPAGSVTYNLIQYGALAGTGGTLSLGVANGDTSHSYTFGTTGGWLTLTIASVGAYEWVGGNGSPSGNWGETLNWQDGSVPASGPVAVNFGTPSSVGTVDLNGATSTSLSALTFRTGTPTTIASISTPGTLTLANSSLGVAVTVDNTHTISSSVNVALGDNMNITGGGALSIAGAITGSGYGIIKAGVGTLTLTGNNTYTGGTTLNAGVVAAGASDALAAGTLTFSGGSLQASGALITLNNATLTLNAAATVDTLNNSLSLTGVIGGTGALAKIGNGTLTLTKANTFSGGATIAAGTVVLVDGNGLYTGTLTFSGAGTLQAGADSLTLGNGTLTLNAATTVDTVSNSFSITGLIGGAGALTKVGTGGLTLNAANTFSGTFSVKDGTLNIGTLNNSGAAGVLGNSANSVVLGDNTGTTTGTLSYTGASATSTKKFTLGGGSGSGGTGVFDMSMVNTLTLSGAIDGTGAMIKTGGGTLKLTGVNTYGGGTTLNAGSLTITTVDSLGASSGQLTINAGTLDVQAGITSTRQITVNNATAVINVGSGFTYANSTGISGNGGLTKVGAGSLSLSGTGVFSGGATISAGTVALSDGNGLSTGTLTFSGAGTLQAGTATLTLGNTTLSLNAAATMDAPTGYSMGIGGIIGGTGGFSKVGSGTLTLNGNNTFTGNVTISTGTVKLGHSNALGTGTGTTTVSSGQAVLDLNGQTSAEAVRINGTGIGGTGALINSSANAAALTGVLTINLDGATIGGTGTITLTQPLATNGGTYDFWKVGVGTLILEVAATRANATALTYINGGTIRVLHGNALNGNNSGDVILDSGTAVYELAGGITGSLALTLNNGTLRSDGNNVQNGVAVAAGAVGTFATVGPNDTFTIGYTTDKITGGSSASTLHIGGAGTVSLGFSNTYSGNWSLDSGIVKVVSGAFGTAGSLTFAGGTLQTGAAVTLANNAFIATGVTADIETVSNTLTLSGVVSGSGSLTKVGASGSLLLSTANTYTGATTINSGTLVLGGSGSIANSTTIIVGSAGRFDVSAVSGGFTLNDGQMLKGTGTVAGGTSVVGGAHLAPGSSIGTLNMGSLTMNGGSLDFEFGTIANSCDKIILNNGTGALTLTGTSTINLCTEGSTSPWTPVFGQYQLIQYSGSLGSGTLTVNSGTATGYTFGLSTSSGWLVLTVTASVPSYEWGGTGDAKWNTGANWIGNSSPGTGPAAVNFGTLSSVGTVNLDGQSSSLTAITFHNSQTTTISGPGTLTLANSGVDAPVTAEGLTHAIASGVRMTLTDNAAVSVAASSGLTIGGTVSGSSKGISKAGSGALTLSGDNSYDGGTSISAGTVAVGSNNGLGAGVVTFSGAGTLQAAASTLTLGSATLTVNASTTVDTIGNSLTINSAVGGTSGLTKVGNGVLSLGGDNTFSGGATITAGTVAVGSNNGLGGGALTFSGTGGTLQASATGITLGSGTLTLSAGATVDTISNSLTINSVVGGASGLSKVGNGVLNLGGANNTYSGGTTLNSGILAISTDLNLGTYGSGTTGTVTFNGGTLQFAAGFTTLHASRNVALGTSGYADTSVSGGTIAGTISGGGALSVVGGNTLSLTGANSFTGGLNIQNGTLKLGNTAAAGAGTVTIGSVDNSATLDLNGASRTISGSLATDGTAANQKIANSSATAATLNYTGPTATFGGLIKDGTGTTALTLDNSGANLTLSGANTYSGGTAITAGTLVAGNTSALGSFSSGNAGTVTMGANGILNVGTFNLQAGALTGSGTVTSGTSQSGTLALNQSVNSTFAGVLQDGSGGTLSLVKAGSGQLTLNSASTFTGGIYIKAGTVALGNAAAAGNATGTITLGDTMGSGNSATLSINVSAAGMNANPISVAQNNTGTATINFSPGGNNGSVNGKITLNNHDLFVTATANNSAIKGGITGTGNLTFAQTGSGLVNMSPGLVDFIGNITFNSASGSSGATQATAGTINNTGTITNIGQGSGAITLSGGIGANVTAITENSATSALTISGASGTLTVNSLGTTLNNNNASGTQILTVSAAVAGNGNLGLNNNSSIALGITVSGVVNNSGSILNSGTGTGSVSITGQINTLVTGVYQNSDTSMLVLGNNNNVTTFLSGLHIQKGTVQLANGQNGAAGGGLVTIGSPSHSGTLDIYSGAHEIKSLATAGTDANQTIVNSSVTAGVLTISGASSSTFAGVIKDGAGSVGITLNAGTLTLSGPNTYTGVTTLSASTLILGNSIGFSSGAGAFQWNGNGYLQANTGVTIANFATLSGNSEHGTFTGSNSATFTGNMITSGGGGFTIHNVATGSAVLTLAGNSINTNDGVARTLGLDGTGTTVVSGNIVGTGGKLSLNATTGAGTVTLAGNNTYSGTTTIANGHVNVTGTLSSASTVTVSGGYLGGTGTVGGTVTIGTSGGIDLQDGAVGTLTLGNNLNFTGGAGANRLCFDLGTGANGTDKIVVGGNTTMTATGAGVIALNQLSGTKINAGTYDLIAGTGSMIGAGSFTLDTPTPFGNSFSLTTTGTTLQLIVTARASGSASTSWSGATGTSSWEVDGNWTSGIPGYNSNVIFYNAGAGSLSTSLNGNYDIDRLTYAGDSTTATTIAAGTGGILTIENTTGITVNTPASGSPTHTISAEVALNSSQSWMVDSGAALTVSGTITDLTGGYSLTKAGTGTLTLSGANTFTGGATISAGTMVATVANALGTAGQAVYLANGATLNLTGTGGSGNITYTGLSSGTLTGSGVANVTLGTGNGKTILNGNFSGFTGTWNIGIGAAAGASKVQMDGADNASAIINVLQNATAYATAGTHYSSIILNGGNTGESYGQLRLETATWAGTITLAGAISGTGNGFIGIQSTSSGTISGNIGEDTAGRILSKVGATTMVLTGTGNSYTGGTTINGGTLMIAGNNNILPTAGTLTLAVATAIFDVNNLSQTVGALVSSSGGTISLGSGTLTVNQSGSTSFNGVITGSGGQFIKSNSGTLTLSGANTYSGGTRLNAGVLSIASDSNLGTYTTGTTGTLTFNGGTLQLASGFTTLNGSRKVVLSSIGYIDTSISAGTIAGTITGGGALTVAGGNALTITHVNSYTGGTTISGSTLLIGNASTLTLGGGTITFNGGTLASNLNTARSLSGALAFSGAATFGQSVGNAGTGNLTLTGAGTLSPASHTLTVNNTTTLSGVIDGSGSITKEGSTGTLILSGDNIYNGATIINAGTLQIGAGGTSGAVSSSSTITDNGVLVFQRSDAVTQGAQFTLASGGTGALVQAGTGTLTLNGVNTYSGGTTLNSGWLNIGHANAIGTTGTLTINGGTLDNTSGSAIVLADRAINIGGSVVFNGSSALNLGAGAMSVTGNTTLTINGANALTMLLQYGGYNFTKAGTGTLIFSGGSAAGGPSTLCLTAGQINFNADIDTRRTLYIANGTTLDNASGSTVRVLYATASGGGARVYIDGSFTYLGTAGSLNLSPGSTTADQIILDVSPTITVNNNTLIFSKGVNEANGSQGLTKAGAGTLTLSSAGSYTGGTTISGGVLNIGAATALGATTGALTFTGPSTLNLTSYSPTIGALVSGGSYGTITANSGSRILTVNQTANTSFGGVIENGGATSVSLVKSGAGTLILAGASTYTGGTTVGGTLIANNTSGSATGTGSVTVSSGSALGGTGTISGSATISSGGTLSPGNTGAPGTLTIDGTLTFASGSHCVMRIASGLSHDMIVAGGLVSNGATLTLTTDDFNVGATSGIIWLINNTGAGNSGTFSSYGEGTTVTLPNGEWQMTYHANYPSSSTGGNDAALIPPAGTTYMFQ